MWQLKQSMGSEYSAARQAVSLQGASRKYDRLRRFMREHTIIDQDVWFAALSRQWHRHFGASV